MWWIILIVVLIILLIIGVICFAVIYQLQYWRFKQVPHESPKKFSELLREIAKHVGSSGATEDELELYKQLYTRFKASGAPFCGFYHLLQPRALILDQELIKRILVKDFSNFNSRGIYYNARDDPLSADLWNRSGKCWKNMRMQTEAIFHDEQMRHLYACIKTEAENFLNELESISKTNQELFDIRRAVKRYVLSTMASYVFGMSTNSLRKKYPLEEFEAAIELLLHTRRHDIVMNAMLTRFTHFARRLHFSSTNRKVANYFMMLIEDIVAEREKTVNPPRDYLQLFIDVKKQELATHEIDEDTDAMQIKETLKNELAANIIGFLKSGFQPIANTLSYILYEFAVNEWVQDRAREEIMDILERNNNELSFDALNDMKFIEHVISETVRVHPVAPFLIRCTLSDYHVPNQSKYVIPKNMYVIIPAHAIHNDPENFKNPQQFDPERFSTKENRIHEQSIWLGFGDGPRACIGVQFAQLQMKVAIAHLLQQYRLTLCATSNVEKSDSGIYVKVKPLAQNDSEIIPGTSVLIQ